MIKYNLENKIKRTKMITTIGPATHSKEKIKSLYENGMTCIRLNFSHGDYEEHGFRIDAVKELRKDEKLPISILLDTKGPEIRVGKFKNGKQEFTSNDKVTIYTDEKSYKEKMCDKNEMTVSYDMSVDLKKGDKILIDDGKLILIVDSVSKGIINATSFNKHLVKENKRINLPGIDFSLDFLSEKDVADIEFACKVGVDYIAPSFVNSANNIKEVRDLLKKFNREDIQIISKIESEVAIDNIDEIIEASDGIMVARGDLGLEIPYYDVPYWQEIIVDKCINSNKLVVIATQMLESMTDNPSPTRAEVTDVYFATTLGSDSVMLSGESANGSYPIITVNTMNNICKRAEIENYSEDVLEYMEETYNIINKEEQFDGFEKIGFELFNKTVDSEHEVVIVKSNNNNFYKILSNFRPNTTILGITDSERVWTAHGITHSVHMSMVDSIDNIENNKKEITKIINKFTSSKIDNVLLVDENSISEISLLDN